MPDVWNKEQKDLAATPVLTVEAMEQTSAQKRRQYLLHRRQRELLEKMRWRLVAQTAEPGERELFGRCPKCGETLGRL